MHARGCTVQVCARVAGHAHVLVLCTVHALCVAGAEGGNTCVGLPVATLIVPPELGFHSHTSWLEWQSTSLTLEAVTCGRGGYARCSDWWAWRSAGRGGSQGN